MQAGDELVNVGLVVVEGHAGAAAGKVLDAQPGEQRLCTVVTGADADAVHVHDARDVVRVDALDVKAHDPVVVIPVDGADDLDKVELHELAHQVVDECLLAGLESGKWPTALVAFNDLVALGAMRQLKQMGLRLPDDMAVIGCDNSFFCPYTDPPLTSMDLHAEERARSAIRELIVARDTDPRPFNIVRDATLVVRESCGAKLGYRKMG